MPENTEFSHPLDKEYKPVDLGAVSRFAELVNETVGTPIELNELVGLVGLAAASHGAILRMAFGPIRANIYGSIIAPSSSYHKTTIMGKLAKAMDFNRLQNCARLPSMFTEEGLIAALDDTPSGIVIKDEVGMLFASKKRKHLETVTQFLTLAFDGGSIKKRLASGSSNVKSPYVNIIGATTPDRFYNETSAIDWGDGFLVRWLYVVPTSAPDFDFALPDYQPEFDERLQEFGDFLIGVSANGKTDFRLEPGAFDYWKEWGKAASIEAYQSDMGDNVLSVTSRYNTYALKFSMLLSIAHGDEWGIVSLDRMKDACTLADNFKQYVYRVLTERQELRITGAAREKVFRIIRDWGNQKFADKGLLIDGIFVPTRKLISDFANVRAAVRDPILDELIDMGAVIETKAGRTKYLTALITDLPLRATQQ